MCFEAVCTERGNNVVVVVVVATGGDSVANVVGIVAYSLCVSVLLLMQAEIKKITL